MGSSITMDKSTTTGHKQPQYNDIYTARGDELLSRKNQRAAVDLMFVGGFKFLIAVTLPLHFVMVTKIESKGKATLARVITRMKDLLNRKWYNLYKVRSDQEAGIVFAREDLAKEGIDSEQGGAGVHISEIEIVIQKVKEKIQTVLFSLDYPLPRALIPDLVKYCEQRINLIPGEQTRHANISPAEGFIGVKPDAAKEYALHFGQYVEVHDETVSNRVDIERSHAAIALYQSGASDGSWYFFNIVQGTRITRRSWTKLTCGR